VKKRALVMVKLNLLLLGDGERFVEIKWRICHLFVTPLAFLPRRLPVKKIQRAFGLLRNQFAPSDRVHCPTIERFEPEMRPSPADFQKLV